jgi:hypothetical protein
MPDTDGSEPVEDDEILYRRIPASQGWYDPAQDPSLSPETFRPGKKDTTGISVDRAKYQSLEEAAKGHPGKTYFVALLRAGDLRKQGIQVVSRPEAQEPGHAELPGLNYENRKSDQVLVWKKLLAHELVIRVEGPFPP